MGPVRWTGAVRLARWVLVGEGMTLASRPRGSAGCVIDTGSWALITTPASPGPQVQRGVFDRDPEFVDEEV